MQLELASEKMDNDIHLVKNKMTNEPIATITKDGRSHQVAWHPDFKMIHPLVSDNILHRNFQSSSHRGTDLFLSRQDALDSIKNVSTAIIKNQLDPDPVKVKYHGSEVEKSQYGNDIEMHHYKLHDDDGNEIGTLKSRDGPDHIRRGSDASANFNADYLAKNPVSSDTKEAARKKFPSTSVQDILYRTRHILDNRAKEPRFIGNQNARAKHEIYKTKMEPEAASTAYEEHLKKTLSPSHEFTRQSATHFTMTNKGQTPTDDTTVHNVMSMPGELHHITSTIAGPDVKIKSENTNIIESKT
jgi:hypothetical protein